MIYILNYEDISQRSIERQQYDSLLLILTKCSDFIYSFHVNVETLEQMAHRFVENVVHCSHRTLGNRVSHPTEF